MFCSFSQKESCVVVRTWALARVLVLMAVSGACPGEIGGAEDDVEETDCAQDFVIQRAEDLSLLDGCAQVSGRILVLESDVTELVLPNLRQVDGSFEIWQNNALRIIDLPSLESVQGTDFTIAYNDVLESVHVPEVTTAGEQLRIYENNRLAVATFTGLQVQAGSLWVIRCASLQTLDLGLLNSVGASADGEGDAIDLRFEYLPLLSDLPLPLLETVNGSLNISSNDALLEVHLPRLERLNGSLIMYQNNILEEFKAPELVTGVETLSIFENPSLVSVDFSKVEAVTASLYLTSQASLQQALLPALVSVGSTLQISYNDVLIDVALENLESVGGDFMVSQNPVLPQCLISQWRDFILSNGGIGGVIDILGNDETAQCEEEDL